MSASAQKKSPATPDENCASVNTSLDSAVHRLLERARQARAREKDATISAPTLLAELRATRQELLEFIEQIHRLQARGSQQ